MAKSVAGLDAFKEVQAEEVQGEVKLMRVGIIGCGGIANSHIMAYKRAPGVEIVAACDIIPGKAKKFLEKHEVVGAKCDYKDHTEMLADKSLKLDAVSICTYNRQHVPCAVAALKAGVNVLLEKPLCVTMDEAWELYKTEKECGKVLSIGFQPRFNENMKDIKRIVQSGILGNVYYVQTGGGRRHGIPYRNTKEENTFVQDETAGLGALADIGCYSLDLVLNALGYPRPITVTGFKSDFFGKNPMYYTPRLVFFDKDKPAPEFSAEELAEYRKARAEEFSVDDFGAGFIRLESGTVIDFRIAWAMNLNTPGDTIFYGTKASLRVPSTDCWNGSLKNPLIIYHEVAGKQVETVIPLSPEPKPGEPNLWDFKIRSFLDACRNGTPTPVSIDEIIYNQAIIDGIVRSSAAGRELVIDYSVMDEMKK